MRASRLLRILLLLQNRGRLTCAELARELEVARRTVLRDVDALTEAGLPVIVHRGPQGGVELGFNYRTRLTGLAADEAEALAVALTLARRRPGVLDDLALRDAGERAIAKLIESFPDQVRAKITTTGERFRFVGAVGDFTPDPRIAALAAAVRERRIVRIGARGDAARTVHPVALVYGPKDWAVVDQLAGGAEIALAEWGDVNISARQF